MVSTTTSEKSLPKFPDPWYCPDCHHRFVANRAHLGDGWYCRYSGYTYAFPPPAGDCPSCLALLRQEEREAAQKKSMWDDYFDKTPPRFRDASIGDLEGASVAAIERFMALEEEWLLLITGQVGRGKTHMGYAVCREWVPRNGQLSVVTVPSMMANIRRHSLGQPRGLGAESYSEVEGLLFMDDLGVEKASEFTIQELYRVIAFREMWQEKTIITTNLDLDEIRTRLTDRIASRLATGIIIDIQGPDRRLQRRDSAAGSDPVRTPGT